MKIIGLYNISNSNSKDFTDDITKTINKLQDDGQQVEIQYKTNISEYIENGIVYCALIIGRK